MCVLKNYHLKNIGKSSYTQKQIYVLILKCWSKLSLNVKKRKYSLLYKLSRVNAKLQPKLSIYNKRKSVFTKCHEVLLNENLS